MPSAIEAVRRRMEVAGRRGARLLATMIAAEFGYASKREKKYVLEEWETTFFFFHKCVRMCV